MDFRSDLVAPAHPAILDAVVAANRGMFAPYGADPFTRDMQDRFDALFERPVALFPVLTGTAGNALSLAALVPPYGAVYCHEQAHIFTSECGAIEFATAGARLVPLAGPDGKLDAATLDEALARAGKGNPMRVQPAALSLTQATELGTVYTPEETAALSAVARRHGLRIQMDGARFANAAAALARSPADLTWRVGVDLLVFGSTKNGTLGAELVVAFDPVLAEDLRFRWKRAGHLPSKARYLSAQLAAYVSDGLWLELAGRSNRGARRIADALRARDVAPACPVEVNEVFVRLAEPVLQRLTDAGVGFHRWDGTLIRLVTNWCTTDEECDRLVELATG